MQSASGLELINIAFAVMVEACKNKPSLARELFAETIPVIHESLESAADREPLICGNGALDFLNIMVVDPEIEDAENNHGQPFTPIPEAEDYNCVQGGFVGRGAKFEVTLNSSMDIIGPETLKDHIQKKWEVAEIKKL